MKKVEGGQSVFYLRSTVLGGQVVAEYNQTGNFTRGYVYDGNAQLLATQQNNAVWWVHTDPVTKSKRVTDRQGAFVSSVDVDPWGGETSRMENGGALSQKYTTYERDGNGRDQAMMRSYHAWFSRFDQPDPFDGSYDLANPQTFNRYAYVNNDPVNFVDPSGLQDTDPYSGDPPPPGGWPPIDPNDPREQVYSELWLSRDFSLGGGRRGGGIRPRLYRLESPGGTLPNIAPAAAPCAGKKGSLDYDSQRRRPDKDGQTTARGHITSGHIRRDINRNQSKYIASSVVSDAQRFAIVTVLNQATFRLATGYRSGNNVVYVYAAGDVELNPTILPFSAKAQPLVGTDANNNNMLTNVNTLVVSSDCQTVITSHPGLPRGMNANDPRIYGTPVLTNPPTPFPLIP